MTVQELKAELAGLRRKLESADANEVDRLELEIIEKQLQMQIVVGSFDPLKELDDIGGVDTDKIENLITQVDAAIEDEKQRSELVAKIVDMSKMALRAAGLPIP